MSTTTEKRAFRMHPQMLYDVIRRQAGTLGKAALEAVMNAVDAQATTCNITVTSDKMIVEDDGHGFRSKDEVTSFFEVFGLPQENATKTYGRFRIGRGQLMAFGRNIWRSATFEMDVDIEKRGLDYTLATDLPHIPGCRIEVQLAKSLLPSELYEIEYEIKEYCTWVAASVTLNGKTISKDPKATKWSLETDDAWYRFNTNQSVRVYNLGVLVRNYPKSLYGIGGEVVSKKELKVNFARNDVLSDCPVWRRITATLRQHGMANVRTKSSLDEGERTRLASLLVRGQFFEGWKRMRLFTLVTGRHAAYRDLLYPASYRGQMTTAAQGSRLGEIIHRQRMACCISETTLDRFGFEDPAAFVGFFSSLDATSPEWNYVPFAEATKGMNDRWAPLPEEEWTQHEQIWVSTIRRTLSACRIHDAAGERQVDQPLHSRKFIVGMGDCEGCTDGCNYIGISREFLKTCGYDIAGLGRLGHLLLHEYCTEHPDHGDHDHDQDFFERYHENVESFLVPFIRYGLEKLPVVMEAHGRKQTRRDARRADNDVRIERAAEALEGE